MGLLRFILASAVVISHSTPILGIQLVEGSIAVQLFYIISGFYMALVLNEKYINSNNSYRLFITNRIMKLLPMYWVMCLIVLSSSLALGIFSSGNTFGKLDVYIEHYDVMSLSTLTFLVLTNLFIFLQDVIIFLGLDVNSGALFFTDDFKNTSPILARFLLIPQGWTLGVELFFYILAPFIVRRAIWVIISIASISLLLRLYFYNLGFDYDPWTYRFFFFEILFFLLGVISYHLYKKIRNIPFSKRLGYWSLWFVVLYIFFYQYLNTIGFHIFLYVIFLILIPFIFNFSKGIKIDRFLGDLSYPIYISHIFFIHVLKTIFPATSDYDNRGFIVLLVVVVFSVVLHELVGKKVEKMRQKRVVQNEIL